MEINIEVLLTPSPEIKNFHVIHMKGTEIIVLTSQLL